MAALTASPFARDLPPLPLAQRRLEALCECGPLGLCVSGPVAPTGVLAALLLGALSRRGDDLLLASVAVPSLELHAVPETDWLAWEQLCHGLPAAEHARRARATGRRLVCFKREQGLLPFCCEAEARCPWTRHWLAEGPISAAARPTAPRSGR